MVKTKCLFISACRQLCQESVHVKPGGGTRYIPGWGGAERPLVP